MPTFSASDGVRVAYDVQGQGTPLICIPGGPGRDPAYLEDLGGLGAQRQLVVLHPRGAGRSPTSTDPADYGAERIAQDAVDLASHVQADPCDLLGHSAGTYAAVMAAAQASSQVRRLVLVTPTRALAPEVPDDTEDILALRSAEPWYASVQEALAESDPGTAAEMISLVSKVSPAFYGGWGPSQQEHAGKLSGQVNLETMERTPDPPALEKNARSLDLAALVITGAQDAASGIAIGDVIAGFFSSGHHVSMDRCGHYPWVDSPELFVSVVENFLRRE